MIYHAYEATRASMMPMRAMAYWMEFMASHPMNPLAESVTTRSARSSCRLFLELSHRYNKQPFGLTQTLVEGREVGVEEEVLLRKPFADLVRFRKVASGSDNALSSQPKVLIVAPMSGHFATLLRSTIEGMLPGHDVYLTDWHDARQVPLLSGGFDLDDYTDYVVDFLRHLGPGAHVMAVCQPSVPVLVACALMAEKRDACEPSSITLMAGPVDTRRNPTSVNEHAEQHNLEWFERNVITTVPWPNPGCMRRVYPGFMQLSGFLALNLERHVGAYHEYFAKLARGAWDDTERHRSFYREYLTVMDLNSEFFLQTVSRVFQGHLLADQQYAYRGRVVDCGAIERPLLLTVEGGNDDVCGLGQTEAAHDLCTGLPDSNRAHYVQPDVGHYGVFSGRRWRQNIQPLIQATIEEGQSRRM